MDLKNLLKTRRSCRQFCQDKPIPAELLHEIVESQRYASCSRNLQTLRYIVVSNPADVEKIFLQTTWGARLENNEGRPKTGQHPVAFVIVLEDTEYKNLRSDINFGLAVSNMTLMAWNYGIASCIIGNICRAEVKKQFSIPENLKIIAAVAFGYPRQNSRIEDIRLGESQSYRLDNGNLVVPKLMCEDTVTYIEQE